MSNPIKIFKERIERLINLEPVNIIRMKLITNKAVDGVNLIIKGKIKNLDDIETKIMTKERWITIKRQWKNLEEFEINKLEIGVSTKKEVLADEENKTINTIA